MARSQNRVGDDIDGQDDQVSDAMAALERQPRAPQGFVAATTGLEGGNKSPPDSGAIPANPNALDVELDD